MEFQIYNRNPFTVEAVMITRENIEEVAGLIGEYRSKGDDCYISLNRRIVPHITRAYLGWWVTRVDNNFRCYSPKAFNEQFSKAPEGTGHEIQINWEKPSDHI